MSNYRRGAIFGLTVAEMFILLTFILLIALLGLIQSEESDPQAGTETSAQPWVRPEQILPLVNAAKDARKNAELAHAAVERERAQAHRTVQEARKVQEAAESARATAEGERDQVRKALIETSEKYEGAQSRIRQLQEKSTRQQQQIRDQGAELLRVSDFLSTQALIEQQLAESESKVEPPSEFNSTERENQKSAQELLGQLKDKESHLQETIATKQQLESEVAQLRQQLSESESKMQRLLSDSKGQDSPCWYVNAERDDGSIYERPLYLFDIKIADEYIYAVYPWNSSDKREKLEQIQPNFDLDEIDRLLEEVIKFDTSVLEKRFAFDEFIPAFIQFNDQGRGMRIRSDRRCTFWVAVWDHTTNENKEGYKEANEDTVGVVFNTFRYKERKWPH